MTGLVLPTQREIDFEHPWLGLQSYDETTRDYFCGRERETREVLLRLELKPLLVLYGRSGLGKSSLVRAGIIPRLRDAGFRPHLQRLTYDDKDGSPAEQVAAAFGTVAGRDAGRVPLPDDALSRLWLRIHSREHPPLITHLFLDQFEEVFTVGDAHQGVEDEVRDILGILLQGAMPEALQKAFEEDDDLLEQFTPKAAQVRVILSMRQDYVFALHRWRRALPQINDNLFELFELSGPQALLAVYEPGRLRCRRQLQAGEAPAAAEELPPIVSYPVAEDLVRYIAGKPAADNLEEITAVPPFLSLICQLLNEKRLKAAPAGKRPQETMIGREALGERPEKILASFYESAFDKRPSGVRQVVEDELLSRAGFRIALDEDSLLNGFAAHCTSMAEARRHLTELVDQRLLSANNSGAVRRYELTHDLLIRLVNDSKAKRQEKKRARDARLGFVYIGIVTLFLAVVASVLYHLYRNAQSAEGRAQTALADSKAKQAVLDNIKSAFDSAKTDRAEAVEKLVADNRALETELNSLRGKAGDSAPAVSQSGLLWTLPHPRDVWSAVFYAAIDHVPVPDPTRYGGVTSETNAISRSGSLATTCGDGTVRFWDLKTGGKIAEWPAEKDHNVTSVAVDSEARFALAGGSGGTYLFDLKDKRPLSLAFTSASHETVPDVAFGTGTAAFSACADTIVRAWTVTGEAGTVNPIFLRHYGIVTSLAFDEQRRRLVTSCDDGFIRVWDLPAKPNAIPRMLATKAPVRRAVLSPAGDVALAASGTTAQLWNPDKKVPDAVLSHPTAVIQAIFIEDGKRVATIDAGGELTIWNRASGQVDEVLKTQQKGRSLRLASNPGGYLAVGSEDGSVELWRRVDGTMRLVRRFQAHTGPVWSVVFSSDRELLVTASAFSEENLPSAKGKALESGKTLDHLPDNCARVWNVPLCVDATALDTDKTEQLARTLGETDFAVLKPEAGKTAAAGTLWTLTYGAEVGSQRVRTVALALLKNRVPLQSIQPHYSDENSIELKTTYVSSAPQGLTEEQIKGGEDTWSKLANTAKWKHVFIQITDESQRWLALNIRYQLASVETDDVTIEKVSGPMPEDARVRYFSGQPDALTQAGAFAALLRHEGAPLVTEENPGSDKGPRRVPGNYEIWVGSKKYAPTPHITLAKQKKSALTVPERELVGELKKAGCVVDEQVSVGTGPDGMCELRYNPAYPQDQAQAQLIIEQVLPLASNLDEQPKPIPGTKDSGPGNFVLWFSQTGVNP